eukprot:2035595-Lingulodinium_polyedra.AAC.1
MQMKLRNRWPTGGNRGTVRAAVRPFMTRIEPGSRSTSDHSNSRGGKSVVASAKHVPLLSPVTT